MLKVTGIVLIYGMHSMLNCDGLAIVMLLKHDKYVLEQFC